MGEYGGRRMILVECLCGGIDDKCQLCNGSGWMLTEGCIYDVGV